jgi:hypothetical protein
MSVTARSAFDQSREPLIATWLYGANHSAGAIAIYIAICAVITLVATALMSDYTGKDDILGEYVTRISGLIRACGLR